MDMIAFANIIRAERGNAGLSQAELAAKACVKVATISRIENGHHLPQARTIAKIANALGKPDLALIAPAPSLPASAQADSDRDPLIPESQSTFRAQSPPSCEHGTSGSQCGNAVSCHSPVFSVPQN